MLSAVILISEAMNLTLNRQKRNVRTQTKFVELMIVADSLEVNKNKYTQKVYKLVINLTN